MLQSRSPAGDPARRRLTELFGPAQVASVVQPLGMSEPSSNAMRPAASAPPSDHLSPGPSALPGPGAFDPGRRGLKALAALAVVVVAVAGYLAWQSRPQAETVPEVAATFVETPPSSSAPTELVVAVTGKVRKPGLVRLPEGARVADAIEAAGGVVPGTDLSTVNLARKLSDGELIAIGVPGLPDGGGAPEPGGGGLAGKVNLNTATLAQLVALPGVGPVLGQRIIDYRSRHGAFRGVGELRQVEGIGDAKYEQLKDLVTV